MIECQEAIVFGVEKLRVEPLFNLLHAQAARQMRTAKQPGLDV